MRREDFAVISALDRDTVVVCRVGEKPIRKEDLRKERDEKENELESLGGENSQLVVTVKESEIVLNVGKDIVNGQVKFGGCLGSKNINEISEKSNSGREMVIVEEVKDVEEEVEGVVCGNSFAVLSDDGGSLLMAFVYAKCSQLERRVLWEQLQGSSAFNMPWVVLGDFNTIRSDTKKVGGRPRNSSSMVEFSECISRCGLMDLRFEGRQLSWCNGHQGLHHLVGKLKRMKQRLRVWNKETFGRVDDFIRELKERVENHEEMLQAEYLETIEEEFLVSKAELDVLYKREEMRLAQQAKIKWLSEGDQNSKFFHAVIAQIRRNSCVKSLVLLDGSSLNNIELVHNGAVNYFEQFLDINVPVQGVDLENLFIQVSRRVKLLKFGWAKWIWHKCLPKKIAVCMWKVAFNCLSVDEKVRSVRVLIVSACNCCCSRGIEDLDHILNNGDFASNLWRKVSVEVGVPFLAHRIIWRLWKRRCAARLEGKLESISDVWLSIKHWVQILSNSLIEERHWNYSDDRVLRNMEVQILLKKQKKIQVLRWLKPTLGRLKLNLDGSSLGNPSPAGGGGVLRDSSGNFIFGFSKFFGSCSNNETELQVVVEGLSICKHLGHDSLRNPSPTGGGGVLRDSSGNFIFGFSKFFGSCSNNETELQVVVEGLSICKHLGHDGIDIECNYDIVISWIRS
ncbi:hypothetical protein LWI28_010396 [Acer negundo]|uniref:RNase H type-1 domain-containing protein n=1 Tax=Acer negundo TaxID=4023 RepID=A0AAD5P1N9_ACENE|nr:hypothetical protein LWI28_010396 [Acer negundo]